MLPCKRRRRTKLGQISEIVINQQRKICKPDLKIFTFFSSSKSSWTGLYAAAIQRFWQDIKLKNKLKVNKIQNDHSRPRGISPLPSNHYQSILALQKLVFQTQNRVLNSLVQEIFLKSLNGF